MKKMKELLVILFLGIAIQTTASAADSSIDKAKEFLNQYGSDNDTFYVEEYPFSNESKQLFVRISASKDDLNINGRDIIGNKNRYFIEMTKQDWFDYAIITCILFSRNSGLSSYDEYYVNTGIRKRSDGKLYPWIISTEEELPQETKLFLGRVAQELLEYNIGNGINLGIGTGGEEELSIRECAGVAVVEGQCEFNQKTYNYITEFTYESENEWSGTYDTVYVGVNDVDLYGEYSDIEYIEVQRY